MTPCPACGAPLGGRDACQAAFDRLGAAAWMTPARAAVHNLVVDTYAMQHPEEYGKSAKSYIAHLTALCCGVEHAGHPKKYWTIPRWLDGPAKLEKPKLVSARGKMTIADVVDVNDEEFGERVRAWARDVWTAYEPQHTLAREWLQMAIAAARQ
jgi:hypothetical protein